MPAPTSLAPSAPLVTGPGFLYWAPVGSTVPTNTVTGSVFTDSWTTPWVFLGPTVSGSDWSYNMATAPQEVAELLDPVAYQTTGRTGSAAFVLANYTASNLSKALNGASLTVTGSTTTTLTKVTPVAPGQETRFMLGWESQDLTIRRVAYRCLNSGDIKETFNKAPAYASIPFNAMFEVPSTGNPFDIWTAGVLRG
jgi:hypothetical protein